MKINIEINDSLLGNAKKITGITDEDLLIEKALRRFVTIENQRKLKDLKGKIELDDEAFR